MGIVMRNILLCLMLGIGCGIYYETIVPMRVWRYRWVKDTAVPAFTLGFLAIALTEIPPYILQPGESDRCFVAGFVDLFSDEGGAEFDSFRAVLCSYVDRDGHRGIGCLGTAAGVQGA